MDGDNSACDVHIRSVHVIIAPPAAALGASCACATKLLTICWAKLFWNMLTSTQLNEAVNETVIVSKGILS